MTSTDYSALFFDRHPQPMWIYDRATLAFLAVNDAAVRHYGYTRPEFMALTVKDLLPPEEIPRFLEKASAGRWTHRKKDGSLIHVIVDPQAMEWNGHAAAVLAAINDITAQVRAEQALRRTEQRLSEIQRVAHVGSWEMDLASYPDLPQNTVHWSEEMYRIVGMEPGGTAIKANDYMTLVHPDDQGPSEQAGRKAIEECGQTDMRQRIIRVDGVERVVHTRGKVICDPAGSPVRMVGTVTDITDREQLERIVSQSEKLSAVGQLAAGIAHEINNPLGVILGFAEAGLHHVAEGEALRKPLESILREARRCTELVQNLLKFSRHAKPGFAPEDPAEVLEGALALVESQARIREVRLERSLDPSLPQIRLDRSEIQQVVINLCVNGLDAMPQGGVLRITAAPVKGGIEIRVKDTGQGIPSEIADRIFDPFFTTKPVGKGTGLGLSLVMETVKKHRGAVTYESAPGQGTTFIVWLPLDPEK
jgi:PAS domain S-box-containing protein